MAKITMERCKALIAAEYPLADYYGFSVAGLDAGAARVRMPYSPKVLRFGGTISGPALMALADFAMYLAVLTAYDYEDAVRAVTTTMNTSFLRLPGQADIVAHARIQKPGRRLCFLEVTLHSDGEKDAVVHVTGAYALPPKGR